MASRQAKPPRQILLEKFTNSVVGLQDVLADESIVDGLRTAALSDTGTAIIPDAILEDYVNFADFIRRNPTRLHAPGGAPALIVPGFLGSTLTDKKGKHGLIWINPGLLKDGTPLQALQLDPWPDDDKHDTRTSFDDDSSDVRIVPSGTVPLAYDLLVWRLNVSGYSTTLFPYDWRKDLEISAQLLMRRLRATSASSGGKKIYLIAHSQGALVARRALTLLGKTETERLIDMLILLAPPNRGMIPAAQAISGDHQLVDLFQNWAINAPKSTPDVLRSFSGLYQLLPWDPERVAEAVRGKAYAEDEMGASSFWPQVDAIRLKRLYGWGTSIDTTFFSARTRIILGDDVRTPSRVTFQNGKMIVTETSVHGDGAVLDSRAVLPGVRTFKALGAQHAWMPATFNVTGAILNIMLGNDPELRRDGLTDDSAHDGFIPVEHFEKRDFEEAVDQERKRSKARTHDRENRDRNAEINRLPAPPDKRRLRVFSMDPLLMSDPDTACFGTMEVEIPWEGAAQSNILVSELRPGPVGEYVEVVDVDPQSGQYYYPVDLNHPHVLAESGLVPTETNPQFHQQMVYAVSMATIRAFELALGRVALWSPRRDSPDKSDKLDGSFVQRLRIYPHAMRQRNAYYDPERKALLFGYFPSASVAGRLVQPGATVFTCLSFDIVAHETTHALLDGLHSYFNTPSNRDVFAFHEAFADIVALLQRFSNEDLMQRQMRLAKGKLTNQSLIGQMAGQFGEASGGRQALRQYLGNFKDGQWEPITPDPDSLQTENESHSRGALLVAAMFQALNSMYEQRSSDLLDVARRDDGNVVFTRELERRLAREASTAAKHLLDMSIRALDYVPPVDIGFGDYLRGLITADMDIVANDKYQYRAAIVKAFSQWGIYPSDMQTLVPDDLRWQSPSESITGSLLEWLQLNSIADWGLGTDRASLFYESQRLARSLHDWILEFAPFMPEEFRQEFGLTLDENGLNKSIRRNGRFPEFEIHSVRPCRRISPDGQTRRDVVIEIVQERKAFFDDDRQQQMDAGELPYEKTTEDFTFRGGCTLIVDGRTGKIRYLMRKKIDSDYRLQAERDYRSNGGSHALAANYFNGLGEENAFRLMHADH